jgi:hypothetical protein
VISVVGRSSTDPAQWLLEQHPLSERPQAGYRASACSRTKRDDAVQIATFAVFIAATSTAYGA